MDQVRLGLIGCGGMGRHHIKYFPDVEGLHFAAICDIDPQAVEKVTAEHEGLQVFDSAHAMIDSGQVDAVFIATPHYDHPTYSEYALERGIHVLVEKPVAVTALAAQQTNEVYAQALKKHPKLQYAGMFNQRTRPQWKQIKKMCDDGTLGPLVRVQWIITTWFRSQAYYNSGSWRATWDGEGGGVLINQCPHNLDLFQWFVGMPTKLWTIAGIGQFHNIEVEDDITTMMQFDNGATGTFITSTGQAPGINQLTIVGENGTLIAGEDGSIVFKQTAHNLRDFTMNIAKATGDIDVTEHVITVPKEAVPQHQAITTNFINVLLGREEELVAPAIEGIRSLELGNAMLLSGLNDSQPVSFPTDRQAFDAKIKDLAANSTFVKPDVVAPDKKTVASF